jgi:hypothetical protein
MTFEMKKPEMSKQSAPKSKAMTSKETIKELEQQIAEQAEQLACVYKHLKPSIDKAKALEDAERIDREAAVAKAYADLVSEVRRKAEVYCNSTNVFASELEKREYGMCFIKEHYPNLDPALFNPTISCSDEEIERGLNKIRSLDKSSFGYNSPDAMPDTVSFAQNNFKKAAQIAQGISRVALSMCADYEEKAKALSPLLDEAITRQNAENAKLDKAVEEEENIQREQEGLHEKLKLKREGKGTEQLKQDYIKSMVEGQEEAYL